MIIQKPSNLQAVRSARLPFRAQEGHHQLVAVDAAEEGVAARDAFRLEADRLISSDGSAEASARTTVSMLKQAGPRSRAATGACGDKARRLPRAPARRRR